MEATTARILDKRRMLKKSKTYRLAIRVTFDRKPVPFLLDLHLSENDFKKLSSPRLGKELSEIRNKFAEEENRAKEIIKNLGTFTFDAFREEFYRHKKHRKPKGKIQKVFPNIAEPEGYTSRPLFSPSEGRSQKYGKGKYDKVRSNIDYADWGPVAVAFGEYIKILDSQERLGTSENYFIALKSLLEYKKNLRFEDITVKFLYDYEQWMLAKKNTLTTVGIYLRNLRCIFNNQISDGLLLQKYYPFGKRKYQIPTGTNVKKALDFSDIKKIYEYQPDPANKNEGYTRDIWLFGFFSNGINPKDIAYLKYGNIDGEFIIIKREKVKFTRRSNPKNILIPINEEMQAIINRWGNQDRSPDNYIFPVLTDGLSAHRRRDLVQEFIRLINDWMKI
ncbi:MAG: phage integrase SAM-like domain-containing protein, partial [Chitinophagaceae bacterium]|nr:phage integrase SAM-like domain-containing protein [Chitinophagaceae bacterium]